MYELYYWPGLPGRGEFVRLVLEQASTPYRDIGQEQGIEAVAALRDTVSGFAPPYLKDGDLVLAQVAAICFYLGQKHALVPGNISDAARALQMLLSVLDVVSEVHDTHHPVSPALFYEDQAEEAKKSASHFLNVRLGIWMKYFSRVIGNNQWLVANTLSVADLGLFQLVQGLRYAFPNAFKIRTPESLLLHEKKVSSLPNIENYLNSGRRQNFNQQGIFRCYPELDLES